MNYEILKFQLKSFLIYCTLFCYFFRLMFNLKIITFLMPPLNGHNVEQWTATSQPARTFDLYNPLIWTTLLSMKMNFFVICKVIFPFFLKVLFYPTYCSKSIDNKRQLYWKLLAILPGFHYFFKPEENNPVLIFSVVKAETF